MVKPYNSRNTTKPILRQDPAITPQELTGLGFNTAEARTISNLTKKSLTVRVSKRDNEHGIGTSCRECSLAIAINRALPILRAVCGPTHIFLESKFNIDPAIPLSITPEAQAVINAADAGKPDPFSVVIHWQAREVRLTQ